ncbi:MAG: hypothetical protein GY947_18365 [Rhodobacteraceae bacterium]|nr:hypothetical protein [Paracoccaceae bacterium]
MKMFDPAIVCKMFDPQAMAEQFGVNPGNPDPQDIIENARKHFDAMAKTNAAATASYRDLMEKQAQIFREVTKQSAEQLKSGPPEDVAASCQQSVKRALKIMMQLSEATQTANQQAFEAVKANVGKAIRDFKA